MIKIDKNVPIPISTHINSARRRKNTDFKYPFANMQIGDSFFVETKDVGYLKPSLISELFNHARRVNIDDYKITTKQVEGGIRCWRVK